MSDKKRERTEPSCVPRKRAKPAAPASCSAFTWQSVEASAKQATLDAIESSLSSPPAAGQAPAAEAVQRLFANARVIFLTSDEQSWVFHVPQWYRKLFAHIHHGAAAEDASPITTSGSSIFTQRSPAATAYNDWLRCVWKLHPKHYDTIKMFGKDIPMPRFQQVYGGDGYRFSGKCFAAQPIPTELAQCIETMQNMVMTTTTSDTLNSHHSYLNGALVNWYADGEHYMGPHTDNEKELVPRSPVFSLSLGGTRRFVFTQNPHFTKPLLDKKRLELTLQDGDLLIMGGTTQETHKHALPKTKKCFDRRVNVTLRCFK